MRKALRGQLLDGRRFRLHSGNGRSLICLLLACLLIAQARNIGSLGSIGEASRERFFYSEEEYIAYQVIGNGPDPVIVLHGFGASSQVWRGVLRLMNTSLSTFYVFDLKGCGQSTSPRDGEYSTSDQAKLVQSFIEEMNLRDVTIVGHSMGGGIATIMAVYALDSLDLRLRKLVLLNPAAYGDAVPFFVRYLRTPIVGVFLLNWYRPQSLARRTLERLYANPDAVSESAVNLYANEWRGTNYRYVLRQTAKQVVPPDFESIIARYREVSIPVFIIWGKQDPVLDLEMVGRLSTDFPNVKISYIQDSGHCPHEEAPAETARLIQVCLEN